MPSSSQTVAELDQLYKNEDGFLYMNYSGENTFGAESQKKTFKTKYKMPKNELTIHLKF